MTTMFKTKKVKILGLALAIVLAYSLVVAFVAFLVMGRRPTPDMQARDRIIKKYMAQLFRVDPKLAIKYRLESPGFDPEIAVPSFYVEQDYFRENLALRRFISEEALTKIGPENQKFSLPLWMDLKVDNKLVGRVVSIKRVVGIFTKRLDFATRPGSGAGVNVRAIVILDNGKEKELMFRFKTHLSRTQAGKYEIDEAVFTLPPWYINVGGPGIRVDWYIPDEY